MSIRSTRLPPYLSSGKPQGRDLQSTVNSTIDYIRNLPRFEVIQVQSPLVLPFPVHTSTIAVPVYVGVNVWLTGDDSVAPGLTEFSWRPMGDHEVEVHTMTGLTVGVDYTMSFFVVGGRP